MGDQVRDVWEEIGEALFVRMLKYPPDKAFPMLPGIVIGAYLTALAYMLMAVGADPEKGADVAQQMSQMLAEAVTEITRKTKPELISLLAAFNKLMQENTETAKIN